jgi:hypothetical protein
MPEETKMPDLKATFDAFYQRFLLRDLFAKIVPGLAILFAIGTLIMGFIPVFEKVAQLSLGGWLVLVGFGWITGFAVQSVGEWRGLIIYYPMRTNRLYRFWVPQAFSNDEQDDKNSWRKLFPILQKNKINLNALRDRLARTYFANQWEFDQYRYPITSSWRENQGLVPERMVVIKEACGNAYVALLIVLIVSLVDLFIRCRPSWPILSWRSWTQEPHRTIAALALMFSILPLARMHFVHVWRQQLADAASVERTDLWTCKDDVETDGA